MTARLTLRLTGWPDAQWAVLRLVWADCEVDVREERGVRTATFRGDPVDIECLRAMASHSAGAGITILRRHDA
jgi:hypothetical protein